MESLLEKLCAYSQSEIYPFHMPGHKRNVGALGREFPNPYRIDITEVEGFDNLHHAEGILKDFMQQAAEIYGSDESFYLINGSSCGILSAVSACVPRRGEILIARNCHKAAYYAVLQNELKAEYVYPQEIESLGIPGGILPEDVDKRLEENPDIQAVLIVSPTFDGMVSDIKKIAENVHRRGKILIVDEAHGAHLPFGKDGDFPSSALKNGADIVIESLHKTLPCLTQTAILHVKKGYLTDTQMEKLKMYLSVYQSSSPSYVLMAGMEYGISFMERQGQEALARLKERLTDFREKCRCLSEIYVPGKEIIGSFGVWDLDESKIVMMLRHHLASGKWLLDYLRSAHKLEMELCAPQYVLALTSVMDEQEGMERLFAALCAADRKVLENNPADALKMQKISRYNKKGSPERALTIFDAMEQEKAVCPIAACEGKISGAFVYVYPPGIPCLVPGERITREIILQIEEYLYLDLEVCGMADSREYGLKVLKESVEK